MKFDTVVRLSFDIDLFHIVLAPLGHHVVVVEVALYHVVDEASFTDSWLTSHNYSCSENRHFKIETLITFKN